eukprot:COSAG02_NODE_14771_length_1237_cov_8.130053_1_plen_108_part_00
MLCQRVPDLLLRWLPQIICRHVRDKESKWIRDLLMELDLPGNDLDWSKPVVLLGDNDRVYGKFVAMCRILQCLAVFKVVLEPKGTNDWKWVDRGKKIQYIQQFMWRK